MKEVKFEDVKSDERIMLMIDKANDCLGVRGYTDHGPRHVGYVSRIAGMILEKLGYGPHRVELAKIAGWVHDVGNLINRTYHSISGATLLFEELQRIGMPLADVCDVCSAVGSHDVDSGYPISDVSAALIIADKVDAYRKRVRHYRDENDIHDRVNMSVNETKVLVSKEERRITYALKMEKHASPMEFMQLYLQRMVLCEQSAAYLGCAFKLVINGLSMNEYGVKE